MEVKSRLTAIDNEVMEEVELLDIDLCVSEIDDWINLKFKDFIDTNAIFSYENMGKILNVIDKQIPDVPRAREIFEKLCIKNNFINNIVSSLITKTVKYRTNVDGNTFDALRYAKLNHPFNILNTIPFIMKEYIKVKSGHVYYSTKNTKFIHKLKGHTDKINYISGSQNIKQIATCSQDQTIRLWDITTGICVYILKHEYPVKNCDYNNDGSKLVSSTKTKTVLIWDPLTGNKLYFVEFSGSIYHVNWMNEYLIAVGNDNNLYATIDNSTIIRICVPCQEKDLSCTYVEFFHCTGVIDGNKARLTSTNKVLYFAYRAFKNSGNDLEKLLNLRASKEVIEFWKLDGDEFRAKLNDKIDRLIQANKLIEKNLQIMQDYDLLQTQIHVLHNSSIT